jgi:hypothetical protein
MKYKVEFLNEVILKANHDPDRKKKPWVLVEKFLPKINGVLFEIPAGYKTDLGSVPDALHFFVKEYGDLNEEYVLHDFLYGAEIFPRGMNDDIFHDAIVCGGIEEWRANIMWAAVRAFGGLTYPLEHTASGVAELRSSAGFVDKTTRPLFKKLPDFRQN